jgi:hypothetical protein
VRLQCCTHLVVFFALFRSTSFISCAIFLTEPTRRPRANEISRALLPFRTNPANCRFSASDQSSDFTRLLCHVQLRLLRPSNDNGSSSRLVLAHMLRDGCAAAIVVQKKYRLGLPSGNRTSKLPVSGMSSGLWGMMRICSVIPHDSAAGEGAQIINPLGLGTVASYCASGVWKAFTLSATPAAVATATRRALDLSQHPPMLRPNHLHFANPDEFRNSQCGVHTPSYGHALAKSALRGWRAGPTSRNARILQAHWSAFLIAEVPTAKACNGKGKVRCNQDFRSRQRAECCNLLARTPNSRCNLHWHCPVSTIVALDESSRNTVVATNGVRARDVASARLPHLARDSSGVRFSPHG